MPRIILAEFDAVFGEQGCSDGIHHEPMYERGDFQRRTEHHSR